MGGTTGGPKGHAGRANKANYGVLAKTSTYTILSTDTGRFFSNAGATGETSGRPFNLPLLSATSEGFQFRVYCENVNGFRVVAGSGDKIQLGKSEGVAFIQTFTPGEIFSFVALADLWSVESSLGTPASIQVDDTRTVENVAEAMALRLDRIIELLAQIGDVNVPDGDANNDFAQLDAIVALLEHIADNG